MRFSTAHEVVRNIVARPPNQKKQLIHGSTFIVKSFWSRCRESYTLVKKGKMEYWKMYYIYICIYINIWYLYIYISIFCNGEMSICQYSTPRVFRKTPGARDGCETLWGHRVKLKLFFGFSRSCTLSIYKRCISYTYIIFVYLIYIYNCI